MGQVILEVPQNVNLVFRIESEKQATDILEQLKRSKFELAVARGEIELPKRRRSKKDSQDVLGIWANRPKVSEERTVSADDSANEKISGIIPPRRNSLHEDGEKVLGIWADRPESAQEIARQIRERNRKVT